MRWLQIWTVREEDALVVFPRKKQIALPRLTSLPWRLRLFGRCRGRL